MLGALVVSFGLLPENKVFAKFCFFLSSGVIIGFLVFTSGAIICFGASEGIFVFTISTVPYYFFLILSLCTLADPFQKEMRTELSFANKD